ncbi:hypothetical protein [Stratiformator vulcanicus]|uniref:Uncharacterized protein n=1 Tax=Stratiformator vulcanicus TaxID=2527980 RepID=A0A517R7A8_9PLAN|nr:hypothetical protein [Stratiformator vulcanicus]QDT39769.1 hypothetical protein Pan189_41800 [Stratiformator vulcanicus]
MLGDQDRDKIIETVKRENRRANRTGLGVWFALGAPAAYSLAYHFLPRYREALVGLAVPAVVIYLIILLVWSRSLLRR